MKYAIIILLGLVFASPSSAQSLLLDGNQVVSGFGPGQTRPPFAYGYLNADGDIVTASPNVNSVIANASTGVFLVSITGYAETDIVMVTSASPTRASVVRAFSSFISEEIVIQMATIPDLDPLLHRVSFVIYKP